MPRVVCALIDCVVETQPFGPALMAIVNRKAWQELAALPDAGEYLTHSCCICGAWNDRAQELNAHLKLHHGAFFGGVLVKSAHICTACDTGSPCVLCGKEYKRQHTCSALVQMTLLWLNTLDQDAKTQALLTCELCHMTCSTMAELHQHLHRQHSLQTCDWNASRDTLPGAEHSCRHCGSVFQSRDGLRRHIIDGRCQHFDASADKVTVAALDRWREVLQNSSYCALTAHDKLSLTLKCQLCLESYTRQMDLQAHLQQAHSALWHQSLPTLRLLLHTVTTDLGCICNPATTTTGLSHVCPGLRQLAMIAEHSEVELVVPMTYNQAKLEWFFTQTLPHPAIALMQQALLDRQFAQLWTLPDILMHLRHWCLLCGGWHHPGALVAHLLTDHHLAMKEAAPYVPQLLNCLQRLCTSDWECFACGQCFNIPLDAPALDALAPRRETQRVHFHSGCPILHQIAILLTLPDGHHGTVAGRGRSSADGEFFSPACTAPGVDDEENLKKKHKGGQVTPPQHNPLPQVIQQMSRVLLQLDKDVQLMKRQDCFLCFMQVSGQSVLPLMATQAKHWHTQVAAQQIDICSTCRNFSWPRRMSNGYSAFDLKRRQWPGCSRLE
eukprot:s1098_g8.t1